MNWSLRVIGSATGCSPGHVRAVLGWCSVILAHVVGGSARRGGVRASWRDFGVGACPGFLSLLGLNFCRPLCGLRSPRQRCPRASPRALGYVLSPIGLKSSKPCLCPLLHSGPLVMDKARLRTARGVHCISVANFEGTSRALHESGEPRLLTNFRDSNLSLFFDDIRFRGDKRCGARVLIQAEAERNRCENNCR